jgi:hypothetical protein
VTRWLIGDLRTGRKLLDLNVLGESKWSTEVNGAGGITAHITLRDPDMIALELRNAATVGKAFIAVVDNGVIHPCSGPIWSHEYDADSGRLTITGGGMWSYFDHRILIPVLADSVAFMIPDPEDPTKTIPNPALDTNLAGLDLGSIAKRLVQQARAHTGGNVPVILEDDRAGIHEKNYVGTDLTVIGDALENLVNLDNGPDIEFTPRFTADLLGVEWVLRTGTEDQPQLFSESTHVWDYVAAQRSIRGLQVKVSGSKMAGRAFATGGRSANKALFARYTNTPMTAAGYPLLETIDSSHSTVSRQSTLDRYAKESARTGSKPIEFWTFEVQADQSPLAGEYRAGDYCLVKVSGDPYIPNGIYRRRLMELSSDGAGKWIKVTTGEVYSLNG